MKFEDYFQPANVIKLLCKYRAKVALDRHKSHLLADISKSKKTIEDFKKKCLTPNEITKLLPPRRKWYKPNKDERAKFASSQKLQEYAINKTIKTEGLRIKSNITTKPDWYIGLDEFLKRINERISNPSKESIKQPKIVAILKENTPSCKECRPISLYDDLEDKIIISQTAKYLTDLFDPYFLDCSYAFRSVKGKKSPVTHHDTILKLCEYRSRHQSEDVYASECDIQKFYDCLNHIEILNAFDEFQKRNHVIVHPSAVTFFKQYLDSYSFSKDVYPLNKSGYFKDKLLGCNFKWVEEELLTSFYPEQKEIGLSNLKIGVPQGGAISCFISNLLLHSVDEGVIDKDDKELLYLRFCDDMVILHSNKAKCENALERYKSKIKELKILIHEPQSFDEYSKQFWGKKLKSKKPYKWGARSKGEPCVPWLSFVGYNIKYDGSIRVRWKSIKKELKKQKEESKTVLTALNLDKSSLNATSKKSKRQQVFALQQRLISMSVGRISIFEERSQTLCWVNGFRALNGSKTALRQLRILDTNRTKVVKDFKKKLSKLTNPTIKPDIFNKSNLKFFGAPFSYHAFLRKKIVSRENNNPI